MIFRLLVYVLSASMVWPLAAFAAQAESKVSRPSESAFRCVHCDFKPPALSITGCQNAG